MILKSLLSWVSGPKSASAPGSARGRQAASRKRPTAERRLTLESLEGRELMAVSVFAQQWKSLTFDAPLRFAGTVKGSGNGISLRGEFHSEATAMAGELRFVNASQASGQLSMDYTIVVSFGNSPITLPDTRKLNTEGQGATLSNGNFSAVFSQDDSTKQPDENPITLTGKVSTKDFAASGKISFPLASGTIKATGNWTASLAPLNPQPAAFDLTGAFVTKQVGSNLAWVLEGKFGVGGSVQKSPSPTTPISNVVFSWADSAGNSIGNLKDKVPIYWNTQSAAFELSQLPVAPPAATQLRMSVTYLGQTTSKLVPLPTPAHITINIAGANVPAGGTGTMPFVVTLSSPTLTNVSFQYTTMDGSGVANQDYVKKSGKLTFKPGGPLSQTINVTVKDDRDGIFDSFNLVGSNPVGGVFDAAIARGDIYIV